MEGLDKTNSTRWTIRQLARFNQYTFISTFAPESISKGECFGIVSYWLHLHLFDKSNTIQDLKKKEPEHMESIKSSFSDIQRLQKNATNDIFTTKGIASFDSKKQESEFSVVHEKMFEIKAQKISNQAMQFTNELLSTIHHTSCNAHINFGYAWMDDAKPENRDQLHPDYHKRMLGHAIGVVKNPTPDCEILFFDPNDDCYAFRKLEDFKRFLPEYFDRALGRMSDNQDVIPLGCLSRLATAVSKPILQPAAPIHRVLLSGIIDHKKDETEKYFPLEEIIIVSNDALDNNII